jgi:hypothetical protein
MPIKSKAVSPLKMMKAIFMTTPVVPPALILPLEEEDWEGIRLSRFSRDFNKTTRGGQEITAMNFKGKG